MFEQYPKYEYTFACIQLIAFMVAMGSTSSFTEFIEVLRRPRSFLVAMAGHLLILPATAFALYHLLGLEPGIGVGLVLVSAMPGGALAKFFTHWGKGNVPLAISLSVVSTLLTLVTVPVLLELAAIDMPETFELPVLAIVNEVVLFVLVPLGVGMFIGKRFPEMQKTVARWGVRLGLVIVVVMVAGSLGAQRINAGEHGWRVPLVIIFFCVFGQQLNQIPFYLFRWERADRMAAGMEVTMRNMNLALLIYASLFARNPLGRQVLFVILFYAVTAMIAGLPLALRHRRMARRERLAEGAHRA